MKWTLGTEFTLAELTNRNRYKEWMLAVKISGELYRLAEYPPLNFANYA